MPRQVRSDYPVRAPAAVGRVVRSGLTGDRVPVMTSRGRNLHISHCERFGSVVATGVGFEISSYSLNPGLANIFPWMCDVANRFEKYKFSKVVFRYVPQSPALAGNVTLAFDFDPNDDPPIDMAQATTYHDYVSTSIWQEASIRLDLQNGDRAPQKNTRPGLPGADLDLNVYDVGNLHVMTEGAAAAVLGYLEVLYEVDLFIHQTQSGVGGGIAATAGLATGALFGTDSVTDAQAILPGYVSAADTFTFTQPFEGLITFYLTGTVFAANTITNTGTATFANSVGRYPTAATSWTGYARCKAATGQTMILSTAAATVTQSTIKFAKAFYTSLS